MAESNTFDINKAIDDIKKDKKLALVIAGFAAALIGLFLPWYEASVFGARISSSPGLGSTGLLIAIAAVVGGGAMLNVLDKDAKQMRTVAIVASALMLFVVLTNYPDSQLGSLVSVGFGYWLCTAGSIAALGGVIADKT